MTTIANLSALPYFTVLDDNGVPISGAKCYTYKAGTSTAKDSYTDYNSGVPASNPIIADSAGRMAIWLAGDGLYKLTFTDASDNLIYTQDNVGASGSSGTAAVVNTVIGATNSIKALGAGSSTSVIALGYRAVDDNGGGLFRWSSTSAASDNGVYINGNTSYGTTGRWVRLVDGDINPRWYGAYGTGTDNDKSYVDLAVTYAKSIGVGLHLTEGAYLLSTTTDLDLPITYDANAKWVWTSFSPTTTAIITDRSQHFDCGSYAPIFPAGMRVNPRWYGAAGDNNPNDSAAINRAIESVTTNGGQVDIDDGIYYCQDAIVPLSNVTIVGQGQYTALKLESATGVTTAFLESAAVTDIVNRFSISKVTLKEDDAGSYQAINISGSDISINNCRFEGWIGQAIQIGNNSTPSDITDITISDNYITETDGIELQAGSNITVTGNTLISATAAKGIVVNPNSAQGLLNVIITNNHCTNCNIDANPNSASSKITGLIVTDNKIDGSLVSVGLSINGTYSIVGQGVIEDNSISLSASDTTGIRLVAGTDAASNYTVTNNNIQADSNRYGIFASGITQPMIVDGNSMILGDGTGIKETSVSDASYGTNVMIGASDAYSVSAPRWCTLGTDFKSQIDGDSTCTKNLQVDGNLINSGRVEEFLGSSVSGTTLTLGQGNVFHISGDSSNITGINASGWQSGSTIKLIVDSTDNVFKHMAAVTNPFYLSGKSDLALLPNDAIQLTLDGTRWIQSGTSLAYGTVDMTSTGGYTNNFTIKYIKEPNRVTILIPNDATCHGTASTHDSETIKYIPAGGSFPWTLENDQIISAVVYNATTGASSGMAYQGGILMSDSSWTMYYPDPSGAEICMLPTYSRFDVTDPNGLAAQTLVVYTSN